MPISEKRTKSLNFKVSAGLKNVVLKKYIAIAMKLETNNNFIVDEKIDLLERMKSIRYNLEDIAFQVVDSKRIRVDVVTDVSQMSVNMGRIDVSA